MTNPNPIDESVVEEVLEYCRSAGFQTRFEEVSKILQRRGWSPTPRVVLQMASHLLSSQHPSAKYALFMLATKAANEWLWADSVATHVETIYSMMRLRRIAREGEEESNESGE